jgi:hypothetical protein
MTQSIRKTVLVLMLGIASMTMVSNVSAQDWPMVGGDYWDVTGIDIKDGGGLKYANSLAAGRDFPGRFLYQWSL